MSVADLQTQLLSNVSGPVKNMLFMVLGVLMFYGVMLYAMRRLQELMYMTNQGKVWSENESVMPGITALQMQRELRDQNKGTALGDVYAYEYKTSLDSYIYDREHDRSLEGDIHGLSMEESTGSIDHDTSLTDLISLGPAENEFDNLRLERDDD